MLCPSFFCVRERKTTGHAAIKASKSCLLPLYVLFAKYVEYILCIKRYDVLLFIFKLNSILVDYVIQKIK